MKRVVVTGVGAITPIGNNVKEFWDSIICSKCGIDYIKDCDIKGSNVKIAAQVKGYDYTKYFSPLEIKKIDRFTQFAIISAQEAYCDSQLNDSNVDLERVSVVFGSSNGGGTIGPEYSNVMDQGVQSMSSMAMPYNLINMAAANVAIRLKAKGSCIGLSTACSSGTDCIGTGYLRIKSGYCDVVIAGSADAAINTFHMAGFEAIGTLSKSNNPSRGSIPFDKERDGFVMGEGAGTLILEELEHAKRRNAKIYAEVVGYGSTCDAKSIVAPDESLEQGSRAMEMALAEAGISCKQLSYINLHGTSTKCNDRYETNILKKIFSEEKPKVYVSSTKSMTGHLLGASGAIEGVICVKALEDDFIPATIGLNDIDEECNLNHVFHNGKHLPLNYVMSNSLGFGGHNATIILKKYKEDESMH